MYNYIYIILYYITLYDMIWYVIYYIILYNIILYYLSCQIHIYIYIYMYIVKWIYDNIYQILFIHFQYRKLGDPSAVQVWHVTSWTIRRSCRATSATWPWTRRLSWSPRSRVSKVYPAVMPATCLGGNGRIGSQLGTSYSMLQLCKKVQRSFRVGGNDTLWQSNMAWTFDFLIRHMMDMGKFSFTTGGEPGVMNP
jgi:hypothetical protein